MSAAKAPNLGIVIAGLLLGILMASMDSTIVATAMGNIVGELGGMDKFVWVTSAYLVAEMAGMPIFGKLSDMYGRKKFFILGLLYLWQVRRFAGRQIQLLSWLLIGRFRELEAAR